MFRCTLSTTLFSYMTFFFFNDTATTEIYTLSLHDALPISGAALVRIQRDGLLRQRGVGHVVLCLRGAPRHHTAPRRGRDRKSTRLNSSHANISYAVFCLKKKHIREPHDSHPINTIYILHSS